MAIVQQTWWQCSGGHSGLAEHADGAEAHRIKAAVNKSHREKHPTCVAYVELKIPHEANTQRGASCADEHDLEGGEVNF